MKGYRPMAVPTPNNGSLKPNLEIACRPETKFFNVHPWISWTDHIWDIGRWIGDIFRIRDIGLASKLTHKEVVSDRTNDAGNDRDFKRFDAVDSKRIEVLGVV